MRLRDSKINAIYPPIMPVSKNTVRESMKLMAIDWGMPTRGRNDVPTDDFF